MATVTQWLDPTGAMLDTSAAAQLSFVSGTNFPVHGLAFDAATQEEAFWFLVANDYGSGNVTVSVLWYADTASSGVVRWGAQIAAITPNTDTQDIETDALATATEGDDTHLGTTGQRVHQADLAVSNLDSLAADDLVAVKVYREAADAADTMTGDAILVGVIVSYSDT